MTTVRSPFPPRVSRQSQYMNILKIYPENALHGLTLFYKEVIIIMPQEMFGKNKEK